MAKGNTIVASAHPQGVFLEGVISGTPKPGTVMEVKPATPLTNGRETYQAVSRASGAIGAIFVLLEDDLQGKLPTDAYVTGTRGRLYAPIAGEELNMLVGDVSGSGDTIAIGDLYGVTTVTGKLIKNSSFASAPFMAIESSVALTADTLICFKYLGNAA
jgi:hypothetical protein